jgi:alcohol dehydrogenase
MAQISFALGVGSTQFDDPQNASASIMRIAELVEQVGLKARLSDFGITASDIPMIAQTAALDAVTLNNPVKPTVQQIQEILERVL